MVSNCTPPLTESLGTLCDALVVVRPAHWCTLCVRCAALYSYVLDVVPHHWTTANKGNGEFVAKYPYCASIRALLLHTANKLELAGHVLVMDSYFTGATTFRELLAVGVHAVGTVKCPTSGVPRAMLWEKKERAREFGDCRHLVSADGVLGVQQWKGEQ